MDVDNDTDLDLFVTEHNGLEPYGLNFLWENQVMVDMATGETSHSFEPFGEDVYGLDYLNSHVVSGDLDCNGWVDFVVHNVGNHKARIWMNGGFDNGHSSITIGLHGIVSNPDAAGAKLTVHSPSASQSRIIHVGENYLSQESEYEVFGLGADTSIDSVTVLWPSGLVELFDPRCMNWRQAAFTCWRRGPAQHHHAPNPRRVRLSGEVSSHEGTGFLVTWTQAGTLWEDVNEAPHGTPSTTPLGRCPPLADQSLCETTIGVAYFPLHGLDTDGHVGVSDLFLVLEELGCINVQRRLGQRPHRGHRGPHVLPRLVRRDLRSVSQTPHVEGHQPQAQHPTSPQHRRHHLRCTHQAMVGDPPTQPATTRSTTTLAQVFQFARPSADNKLPKECATHARPNCRPAAPHEVHPFRIPWAKHSTTKAKPTQPSPRP